MGFFDNLFSIMTDDLNRNKKGLRETDTRTSSVPIEYRIRCCNADLRKMLKHYFKYGRVAYDSAYCGVEDVYEEVLEQIRIADELAMNHGCCFEMESDVEELVDTLKQRCNEEKERKQQQEIALKKQLEKKALRLQEEKDAAIERHKAEDECRKILMEAQYNSVKIILPKSNYRDSGYEKVHIKAKRPECEYYIRMTTIETFDGFSYSEGHTLIKLLSNVLSKVDLSDIAIRASFLRSELENEGFDIISLENAHQSMDNYANITTVYNNKKYLLEFYASRIKYPETDLNEPTQNHEDRVYDNIDFDTMNGHEFEYYCAEILEKNGYQKVNVTQGSGDQGIDVIAVKDGIKYGIQCKCYSSDIGNKAVQEVFAGKTFYQCHVGIVLTNRHFTKSAIELAESNGVVLWDRDKLMELVERGKKAK